MRSLAKRSGHLTETAIDDEIVVMRLDNGEFFALSETAAVIWRLIDGNRNREAIVDELQKSYGDTGRLSDDVDAFLAKLKQVGLIEER